MHFKRRKTILLNRFYLTYKVYEKLTRTGMQNMGGSPSDVSEEAVTQEKRKKGWRISCDVGEATEALENEL